MKPIYIEGENIERVISKDKRKDGTPYIDKNGKPFKMTYFKLSDTLINDQDWQGWCSVNNYSNEYNYQQGDKLTGNITKVNINDATFWNFRHLSRVDVLATEVDEIKKRLDALEGKKIDDEINNISDDSDDLPF